MNNEPVRNFEGKVFKNGNSLAVYIPKAMRVEEGKEYIFWIETIDDENSDTV